MLSRAERAGYAARFGVAPDQIDKDHLVSHILLALSRLELPSAFVFLGGTAVARTHLLGMRLSEDIDLWADRPADVLSALAERLPTELRREYPGSRVELDSRSVGIVRSGDGLVVRVQVVSYGPEYDRCISTEPGTVRLHYGDLPDEVTLRTPTLVAFSAMKHLAWVDRHAPRDLVDLLGLARIGGLTSSADRIVACLRGFGVRYHDVDTIPPSTRRSWHADLDHQMRQVPEPDEALAHVRDAWTRGLSWELSGGERP